MAGAADGSRRVPDAIAEWYVASGVRQCFGVVGSTNFEVTQRLVERGVDFVAARHETNAVVMAHAWALATGEVGLASVHTGPGLTNAATGIAEVAKSRTPSARSLVMRKTADAVACRPAPKRSPRNA